MQPAFSVILLTTLIGAGQGLFLALVAAQSAASFQLLSIGDGRALYGQGSVLALLLLGGGLVASFFHLGRPERAWRAMAQWRTSWLSREVIVLPAFMAAVFAFGAAHLAGTGAGVTPFASFGLDLTLLIGAGGAVLALALFICTGMIYACLPFLREWHTPLTVVNYIALGSASGFTLAGALAAWTSPELTRFFAAWALAITAVGLAGRSATLVRNSRLRPHSTLQTAIGIKHPRIAQKAQGFTGSSFNTREFRHGATARRVRSVKWLFLAGAFALPMGLLAAHLAGAGPQVLPLAFAVQYLGLLAERWFFFAQANHPQNLYYQSAA